MYLHKGLETLPSFCLPVVNVLLIPAQGYKLHLFFTCPGQTYLDNYMAKVEPKTYLLVPRMP